MSTKYVVGYRKPPKRTRFKKGQSGNYKGRPKGTRNLRSDLAEELRQKILVTEGGVRRPVSKQRAVIKSLIARALQGDARAIDRFVDLVVELLPQDEEPRTTHDISVEDDAIIRNLEMRMRRRSETPRPKS